MRVDRPRNRSPKHQPEGLHPGVLDHPRDAMARSPSIFLQGEEEDSQLAPVAFECLARMSPQIVQSSSLVIVVEAPFVAEAQTAVQLEVVPIHRVSVRRWIVL